MVRVCIVLAEEMVRTWSMNPPPYAIWLHGLVPMWWDTGEMIDRNTGAVKPPDEITTIVNATK